MKLTHLRVQNFRTHSEFSLNIGEGSTLILGKNGSGKTSLLEAIYFALRGTSFRSSDKEILKNYGAADWFRIDLAGDNQTRVVKFDNSRASGKKTFEIDGKKSHRLSNSDKRPVILFEPDDLQLLSGSPNRRRDFLDKFLSQIFPSFSTILSRYNKALKQRNNLLKREILTPDEIFPWNVMLAEYAAEIISRRHHLVNILNEKIEDTYFKISKVRDEIEIIYQAEELSKDNILRILESNFERDRILGHTSFGPHKDDLSFIFNGKEAQSVASRGENRSLVLALKFIETDFLAENSDFKPIVLLDDVFSELDEIRQKMLTEHFGRYQTIITSTSGVEVSGGVVRI
ncbi:MAG: DNA replication and repair protein RecF [bacterium]|nr:DNA replication and repair protein RecF [bacterium]